MTRFYYFNDVDVLASFPELTNRLFTESQLYEICHDLHIEEGIADFSSWLADMLKCDLVKIFDKNMNSVELQRFLADMAERQLRIENLQVGKCVIDCIIKYYNNTPSYYPEHAVRTFHKFLESAVLDFSCNL